MTIRILVIDDDSVACEFLQEALSRAAYKVDSCTSPKEALDRNICDYDVIISDLRMPEMDGLQLLKKIRARCKDVPFILVTAYGSLGTTMEALRLGAWDYISKPFSPDSIRSMVRKVLEIRELHQGSIQWKPSVTQGAQLVGSSAVMVDLYKQLARIADAWASVLVEGESGTGKELTAQALHQMSSRKEKPFVVIHCGAIPDTLLESELFGYEKGAFTGAEHTHCGLLESANEGTIFLDEITEMSTALQGKLLRFMQNGEVRRLGSVESRNVAVRVIGATNRSVDEEVAKGTFRSDLLYRFVVRLRVPPLQERKSDLPQLTEFILAKLGYSSVRISDEAMDLLMACSWPGNVRELENVLQQTLLLSPFSVILSEHLPEKIRTGLGRQREMPDLSPLETVEREKIIETLKSTGWNKSRTAHRLGIDRKTLRLKIQRYGLVDQEPAKSSDGSDDE